MFFPQNADAARRRVIFQLANLRHWADLEYTYEGDTFRTDGSSGRSSQDHEFKEIYHLEIDYALFNYRIANGSIEVDLGWTQNMKNIRDNGDRKDQAYGLELEYLLDLNLFERRPYPVSLSVSQLQERVDEPFSQNYDLTNMNFSTLAAWRNKVVPLQLAYRYFETQTDGLSRDRRQMTDEISLTVDADHGDFGSTRARGLKRVSSTTLEGVESSGETDTYEFETDNILTWDSWSHEQLLQSTYRRQRDKGLSSFSTTQWDERLDLQLGKALETGASYQERKTEQLLQSRLHREGKAWIEHRLFNSLTTRVERTQNWTEYNTGEEQSEKNQISFLYTKKLPAKSQLRLAYSFSAGLIDRDLSEQEIIIINEQLTVQVDDNYLIHRDVIVDSVDVYSEDRSVLYSEGIDYTLEENTATRELELVFFLPFPSGNITSGETLSIDYHYQINNSIEYSTTLHKVSTSLSLFENRYRIYGHYSNSDEDLESGEVTVSPLIQKESVLIGVEANFVSVALGSSVQVIDSTLSRDENVEVFVNYWRDYDRSVFSVRLSERYTLTTDKDGFSEDGGDETEHNSIRLNAEYRRRLNRNTDLTFKGHVIDYRGDREDKDDLFLGVLFESRWYKFMLRVSADVTWEIYDQRRTRDDRIFVGIRRYF